MDRLEDACEQVIEGTRFNTAIWKRKSETHIKSKAVLRKGGSMESCDVELIKLPCNSDSGNNEEYLMRIRGLGDLNSKKYLRLKKFAEYIFGGIPGQAF